MYFSTLLMDPFLSEPVGSPLSSWGSGIVTSAQPGGSLWAELTFPVPPWAALGHCGLELLGTALCHLPPPWWHLGVHLLGSAWLAFGGDTTGSFCLLTPKIHLWIVPGESATSGAGFIFAGPCAGPPPVPMAGPRLVVQGLFCTQDT